MSINYNEYYIIKGIDKNTNHKMRPGNWNERLAGAFNVCDPKYAPHCFTEYAFPVTMDNTPAVAVAKIIETSHPHMFEFFMSFAKMHNLVIQDGLCRKESDGTEVCAILPKSMT